MTYDEGLPHVSGYDDYASAGVAAPTAEVVDAVRVGPYMATVTLHRRQGGWLACAQIETSAGPLRWCGVAREREVADRLARQHQGSGATAGNFGNFFRDLSRTIQQGTQQLARNRALRNTVSDIRRTMARPELQPVFAVAQQIPYLGPAVTAFRAATTIVDDVLGGNPETRNRLTRIRQAAQGGNPIAREAMSVIESVLQSQQRVTRQRAQGQRAPGQRAQGQRRSQGQRRGRRPRRGQTARRPPSRRPPSRRPPSRRPMRRTRSARRGRVSGEVAGGHVPSAHEQDAWHRARQQWAQQVAGAPAAVIVPQAPGF